ncbi:VOC family protein [Poseidonocella sedimentorum]|nr:VOC family protein [Poseidonocella sedimentorum]
MSGMVLDAVGVTARDMGASVAFYERLGFSFAPWTAQDKHVEAQLGGAGPRLMIDAADLAEGLIGAAPRPANHAQFALLCAAPSEVDARVAALAEAGHRVEAAPFDAPWGQRYATVADPEGYLIDLFAAL